MPKREKLKAGWKPVVQAIPNDGHLARKGDPVQLLYMFMCLWASPGEKPDDSLRYYADPFVIKGNLFPHNDRTVGDMVEKTPYMIYGWLRTLERMRYIRFYKLGKKAYLLLLEQTVILSNPGAVTILGPEPGYTKERYIPSFESFTADLHTDELPFDDEPPDAGEPPDDEQCPFDSTEPTNNECCLTDNAAKYGLNAKGFKVAIVPYCQRRRSDALAWCYGHGEHCDERIMAVIKRIKKQKATIRNYPTYLMKALQKDLMEHTEKPPDAEYSTGPGGKDGN